MHKSLAFAVCLSCSSLLLAADTVSVKPTQISETRIKQIGDSNTAFNIPRLEITLHVDGDTVKGATSYGKMKIAAAHDDLGADLTAKDDANSFHFSNDDDFRKINQFNMGNDADKKTGFDVEVDLSLTARKATKITEVKGEFQVQAGGDEKIITLTKPKSLIGKPIVDPALKLAGLEIQVLTPPANEPTYSLQLKGKTDALKEVEILDASGKKINNSEMTMGMNGTKTSNYSLEKPLDDTFTIKLHVLAGLKTVTVPFDLKDLQLP